MHEATEGGVTPLLPGCARSPPSLSSAPCHCQRRTQIKLGTVDQQHAENEFILRSYVNSAKRSKLAAAEEEEQ